MSSIVVQLFLLIATMMTSNSFLQSTIRSRGELRLPLSMSLDGKASFLADKDENIYLTTCLRRAVDSTKILITEGVKLIEIEFPPSRKNDLSVGETLDTNRKYVGEFVKQFASQNLWLVFPDKKETFLAKQKLGDKLPYLVTSIEGILQAKPDTKPELLVIVNPGFPFLSFSFLLSNLLHLPSAFLPSLLFFSLPADYIFLL